MEEKGKVAENVSLLNLTSNSFTGRSTSIRKISLHLEVEIDVSLNPLVFSASSQVDRYQIPPLRTSEMPKITLKEKKPRRLMI